MQLYSVRFGRGAAQMGGGEESYSHTRKPQAAEMKNEHRSFAAEK